MALTKSKMYCCQWYSLGAFYKIKIVKILSNLIQKQFKSFINLLFYPYKELQYPVQQYCWHLISTWEIALKINFH